MTRLRTPATAPQGRRRAVLVPVLGLLLAVTLAACGSGGGEEDGVATLAQGENGAADGEEEVPTDPAERALAFAECMRENGVPDFPDPELDADGNPLFKLERRADSGSAGSEQAPDGEGPAKPEVMEPDGAMQQAMEACADLSPRGEISPEDQAAMEDAMLEFAQCMRDHGIDMPDPDFSGDGAVMQEFGGSINPDDPRFQEAQEACQGTLGDLRGPAAGGSDA